MPTQSGNFRLVGGRAARLAHSRDDKVAWEGLIIVGVGRCASVAGQPARHRRKGSMLVAVSDLEISVRPYRTNMQMKFEPEREHRYPLSHPQSCGQSQQFSKASVSQTPLPQRE
jgi:hypothetical protein